MKKFDKSRVYTAINADEVAVGCKGYFADDIGNLRDMVMNKKNLHCVCEVRNDYYQYRFKTDEINEYALFYLVEEPEPEPKEVTAKEWDNRPRLMKVWDDNYSKATKGKVIYIAPVCETTLPVITFVSLLGTTAGHVICYKHCAEIESAKETEAEKSYRPYNNADEFMADYKKRFCPDFKSVSAVQVRNKEDVLKRVIGIFNKDVLIDNDGFVSFSALLDAYTYPDGSTCGMEEM